VKGVQWGLGAVGRQNGPVVALSILLDRAASKDRAREVILEGADGDAEDPKRPRQDGNLRGVFHWPKAREDVLLAYK